MYCCNVDHEYAYVYNSKDLFTVYMCLLLLYIYITLYHILNMNIMLHMYVYYVTYI